MTTPHTGISNEPECSGAGPVSRALLAVLGIVLLYAFWKVAMLISASHFVAGSAVGIAACAPFLGGATALNRLFAVVAAVVAAAAIADAVDLLPHLRLLANY